MNIARPRLKAASVVVMMASVALMPLESFAQTTGVSFASGDPVQPLQVSAAFCKRSKVATVGQFATGVFGAWLGGLVSFAAVQKWDPSPQVPHGDDPYKPNANTAYTIGSWLGSTALIYFGGKPGCGSLGQTAVGTGLPSILMLFGRHEPFFPIAGFMIFAPIQSAIGTAMFPK